MRIIVQKFGGTSVASEVLREEVCARVSEARKEGFSPVVVVSAMGRQGEPYATDTLRELALTPYPESSQRELDLIMSCGEVISAVIMANTLRSKGIKARALTGGQTGMITDGIYGEADVVSFRPENITKVLEAGEVAVVTGFQGMDEKGDINTLGRGGSDTSAVIIGAGLKAEKVEIYTDVDGIMTADPKMCSEARTISHLTYNEVCQMAYEGAKVIHPRAVEVAMQNNTCLSIKNLKQQKDASIITGDHDILEEEQGNACCTRGRKVVTGIADTSDLVQVLVDAVESNGEYELELFERIGEAHINIDLINVFPHLKVFTIKKDLLSRTEKILQKLNAKYKLVEGCAKVSVVGVGMRNIPGVMAKVVKALHQQGIQIMQTGDSNITISLLIKEEDLKKAIKTLHDHFDLGLPVSQRDEKILA